MSNIEYPADVIRELASIRAQSEQGITYLADAETKLVHLELAAERAEALALLEAQGTVPERQAVSKLASQKEREAAMLARIEINRVKTKLKHLTDAQMAVQTAGRMIELEYKTTR